VPYWRMFCHIVWTTKDRRPTIEEIEEEILAASFKATFTELDAIPHAVGFMPDHVHIAASVPPKNAVADLVRRLKGASTRAANLDSRRLDRPTFGWQDSYGVLSFGEKALPDVIAYITTQKERHNSRDLWQIMERTSDDS
jgi:putative transposase